MARFSYKAIDSNGDEHEGELDCETIARATAELESIGWTIVTLEAATASNSDPSFTTTKTPSDSDSSAEKYRLDAYFDSVIARRDQLIPVLTVLTDALPRGTARQELQKLNAALKNARSGSELSSSPYAIRWLPMLLTGLTEKAATERLSNLVAITARDSHNRNDRRRTLLYPMSVLLITFGFISLLCGFIVPYFEETFEDFGIRIPASTRLLIDISNLFTDQRGSTITILGVASIILTIGGKLWTRYALSNQIFGRLVAGSVSNVIAMASLINQLADLLRIGIVLPDALRLAGKGCEHPFFRAAAEDLAQAAQNPSQALQSSQAAGRLPANLIHALTAGPDSTPHLPLLHQLGAIYSYHATHRTSWTTGAAAQLSIVVAGLAVGFVVIALLAPLLSLVQGLV